MSSGVQFLSLCVINLSVAFRTTADSAGLVSNKDPPLHRPAELKVLGGSTYCKSYDRLFKTQVWQFVSPKMEDESKAQRSSVKTMQSLFSPHWWSTPFFSLSSSPYSILRIFGLHFSSSNCWTNAEVSEGSVMKKDYCFWKISSAPPGCWYFSYWYLRVFVINV